jgi:hypothetical protein
MTIQKKSLISTLKTTKKANIATSTPSEHLAVSTAMKSKLKGAFKALPKATFKAAPKVIKS